MAKAQYETLVIEDGQTLAARYPAIACTPEWRALPVPGRLENVLQVSERSSGGLGNSHFGDRPARPTNDIRRGGTNRVWPFPGVYEM